VVQLPLSPSSLQFAINKVLLFTKYLCNKPNSSSHNSLQLPLEFSLVFVSVLVSLPLPLVELFSSQVSVIFQVQVSLVLFPPLLQLSSSQVTLQLDVVVLLHEPVISHSSIFILLPELVEVHSEFSSITLPDALVSHELELLPSHCHQELLSELSFIVLQVQLFSPPCPSIVQLQLSFQLFSRLQLPV
jgi:hypothetical protein